MDYQLRKAHTLRSSSDDDQVLAEIDAEDGHQERWHAAKHRQPALISSMPCRWALDTSLLLVIAGLLVLVLFGQRSKMDDSHVHAAQIGGDYTGSGLPFQARIVKWNMDEAFVPPQAADWFSERLLAKWNTIMPAGTSTGSAEEGFATTSMTHSLHCLFMMGRAFSAISGNISGVLPHDYFSHYMHCIDYIRQSVMCAGDMSMEPHLPTDGEDNGPLDGGWNGIHVCKDYSQVITYLEGEIADGTRVVLPLDD